MRDREGEACIPNGGCYQRLIASSVQAARLVAAAGDHDDAHIVPGGSRPVTLQCQASRRGMPGWGSSKPHQLTHAPPAIPSSAFPPTLLWLSD